MTRVLLVLFASLLAFGTARAEERKQVAILDFTGPRATSLRGEVMRLVAVRSWLSAQSRLDGRTITELADEYELDLVIDGTVQRRGRDFVLRIRFVRGTTGLAITTTNVTLHGTSLDRVARRRIEHALDDALAMLPSEATACSHP